MPPRKALQALAKDGVPSGTNAMGLEPVLGEVQPDGDTWDLHGSLPWGWTRTANPQQAVSGARVVPAINGRLRDECLMETLFTSMPQARAVLAAWQRHYTTVRPHSKLDGHSPAELADQWGWGRTVHSRPTNAYSTASRQSPPAYASPATFQRLGPARKPTSGRTTSQRLSRNAFEIISYGVDGRASS